MGRVKIAMKTIENKDQRNIAFAKRKCGLIKKAYELYILCDVQIALILFSPSGKLFLFESKTRIEETIQKYVELPGYIRPINNLHNEPYIRRWINDMRGESKLYRSNFRENFGDGIFYHLQPKDIEDKIDECNAKLADVERELGYYLNSPSQCGSRDELEFQETLLHKALEEVKARKQHLEVESKLYEELPNWLFDSNLELEIPSME